MKLVANIKLKPTSEQEKLLRETLERCNQACNFLAAKAWEAQQFRQFNLHKAAYRDTRKMFDLTAQVAVRCIAKVADAYKLGRKSQHTFRRHAAQPYDDRIFRFIDDHTVSIWTVAGRQKIACVMGDHQRRLLAFRKGEVDLMFVRGKWYVACVCDIDDPKEIDVEGILGVDFGIVNIAFDSQGRPYTGDEVERVRQKYARRRSGLQRRGTKAAKRRLKKLSGKESRFRKHTNHVISKEIVATAERDRLAIAIENLTHIRKRVQARKSQRNRLHSWSFAQLRQFVTYKAKRAGIPIAVIDPRNTSMTCPCCGTVDKANRKTQAQFSCVHCGYEAAADFVAATNIASVAAGAAFCNPALSSAPL